MRLTRPAKEPQPINFSFPGSARMVKPVLGSREVMVADLTYLPVAHAPAELPHLERTRRVMVMQEEAARHYVAQSRIDQDSQ
jgi:hypothetical protein